MVLKCEQCGVEFRVQARSGPEDPRIDSIDWLDGPYHCFVCGGLAETTDCKEELQP